QHKRPSAVICLLSCWTGQVKKNTHTLTQNTTTFFHKEMGSLPHLNISHIPMQFGFRANYSTETATCFFTENIRILLDRGGVVDSTLMLILIPVVIVTLICMVVCGYFIIRKWKQNATKREDPFLDEPSTEKVPMPMFEEDVPSVLELEMEDFDQWITKDCKFYCNFGGLLARIRCLWFC
uniref:Transmembrane protein 154 n=1 Tax=Oryzias latipes TaxID=8090 RepID=A0A3P9L3G9_ORYLA